MKDGINVFQKVSSFLTADRCTLILEAVKMRKMCTTQSANAATLIVAVSILLDIFMCSVRTVSYDNPEHS